MTTLFQAPYDGYYDTEVREPDYEFFRSSIQKAAIPHKCNGCDRPITVGQKYIYFIWKIRDEGYITSERWHYTCHIP